MMQNIFEQALNLQEPWYIKNIDFDYSKKKLNIDIDFRKGSKFEYFLEYGQSKEGPVHDTVQKQWKHLNFFEHECYLNARIPRVKKEDHKVKTIRAPWEGKMKGFTLLFEALLLQLCTAMPVLKVSQLVGVSDDKIWLMLERYVEQALSKMDLSELAKLGIDETSLKKNHNYITLFVNLATKKIVYIADGKDSKTVTDFVDFMGEHNGIVENITDVSSDMSPAFIKGVKENLPNADITFDKFHILKIINKAVDDVRKKEVTEQYKLKGNKYIFLKNNKNLTDKQRATLNELKISKLNLKSIRALHIRENFQELYNSLSLEDFEIKLKKWYFWATHSRMEPMKKAAYTIKNHWEGVLRWWTSKINNGVLEGLNSVIQAAKAKARGYKLPRNFKIISYLIAGDIDLKNCNPYFLKLE